MNKPDASSQGQTGNLMKQSLENLVSIRRL